MHQAHALDWLAHDDDVTKGIWARVRANINLRDKSHVYKANDLRLEPTLEARQLVIQMVALAFTPEATRSVLGGINPHKSAGHDSVQPNLVKILARVSQAH